MNNQPVDDFEGLSSNEVHRLLHFTLETDSPLKIETSVTDEVMDQVPFFRLMEEFLKIIEREEAIKLTPHGYLQRKVMTELYAHRFITSRAIEAGYSKLNREEDWMAIYMIHACAEVGKYTRKLKGRYVLTKTGKFFLKKENRMLFFYDLFRIYTERVAWNNLDTFTLAPVGQLGWGFSVMLLLKYGNEELTPDFYTEKYLKAFPTFLDQMNETPFNSAQDFLKACYQYRSTECFMPWWGLLEYTEHRFDKGTEHSKVIGTPLLRKLFHLESEM
jgi:hypothetical protein